MEIGKAGLEWMGGTAGEADRKKLLETFDEMSNELEARATRLAGAHERIEKNIASLAARLTKSMLDGRNETSETLQRALLAINGRLDAIETEMSEVCVQTDAIDEQYLMANRLPPPINE